MSKHYLGMAGLQFWRASSAAEETHSNRMHHWVPATGPLMRRGTVNNSLPPLSLAHTHIHTHAFSTVLTVLPQGLAWVFHTD